MTPFTADGLPFSIRDEVMSRIEAHHRLRDGALRRVLRGVYVDARVPDSRELRILAVDKVRPPDGVACSETAAWVMGVNVFPPGRQHDFVPTFLVPHGTTRITMQGVACRQALLSPHDVTDEHGTLTTTAVRTTSDLLRRQYRPYALASGDQMLRAGLIDLGELSDAVHRLKGFPGIRQARSLVGLIDALAESPGESWTRLRLHDAGFPHPELQVVVIDRDGIERRLDMAYVLQLAAAEFDGRQHHTSATDTALDRDRRDPLSAQLGWRFVIARRESLFGPDDSFERRVGELIGFTPIPRWWGKRALRRPSGDEQDRS
ncbi:hypothetical protein [Aeromicrobium sp. Leaf350]|uniref:hypothetical protein n=1 Tax=Aeromicrobium sp. Leaf350 TaxID=2876565 RepID=UPI001E31C5A9|nr:hypothetical protein [Aeromicrobium sp. Leaf350]